MRCLCCLSDAKFSIELACGVDKWGKPRYYLPNQFARQEREAASVEERWFCGPCMRRIEDAFRGAIRTLQDEHGGN